MDRCFHPMISTDQGRVVLICRLRMTMGEVVCHLQIIVGEVGRGVEADHTVEVLHLGIENEVIHVIGTMKEDLEEVGHDRVRTVAIMCAPEVDQEV